MQSVQVIVIGALAVGGLQLALKALLPTPFPVTLSDMRFDGGQIIAQANNTSDEPIAAVWAAHLRNSQGDVAGRCEASGYGIYHPGDRDLRFSLWRCNGADLNAGGVYEPVVSVIWGREQETFIGGTFVYAGD